MISTRLQRCLWMALYLQRFGRITYPVVREGLGVSMTTYRRCLRDLREAGMILDGRSGGKSANRLAERCTAFVAFDERLASARVA
jgi:predicted DNA-binding transcriptional regulator YafY